MLPASAKADAQSDDVLPLEALRRFADPQGQFLAQRLGLRLPEALARNEDVEPLVLPAGGPEGASASTCSMPCAMAARRACATACARALLPSGALGARQFDALLAQVRPFADASAAWVDGAALASDVFETDIDGLRAWPGGGCAPARPVAGAACRAQRQRRAALGPGRWPVPPVPACRWCKSTTRPMPGPARS
jgi:hypothetical protein